MLWTGGFLTSTFFFLGTLLTTVRLPEPDQYHYIRAAPMPLLALVVGTGLGMGFHLWKYDLLSKHPNGCASGNCTDK
jgi:hypothetical protein